MGNNFFNDSNKVYSENLNDGILVGNAFDWTVEVSLPSDTGSVFPNSSTIVMAKVADVSITPNSNLRIGSSIENSSGSSQVYRLTVYPNFNRFGGFKSITLEGDGTFYIANKGANTPIANNLDYDNLSNVPELKVLKEYDIVVTIPNNGEVTGLGFVFQSSSANVSGSISQDNVIGTVDLIYPVGSIYMSVNNTNPSVLFGGTWEQLKDKFLLASGDTYPAGNTGGEATHTLTTNEMPSHTHTQNAHNHTQDSHNHGFGADSTYNVPRIHNDNWGYSSPMNITHTSGSNYWVYSTSNKDGIAEISNTESTTATNQSTIATNQNTGGGQAHNNMPPYLAVYMWKRTA